MKTTLSIQFPNYFQEKENFQSLAIGEQRIVDYAHSLDYINDVQLKIDQLFVLYVVEGTVRLEESNACTEVNANQSAVVRRGQYLMSEALSDDQQFKALLFFLSDEQIRNFCIQQEITADGQFSDPGSRVCPLTVSPAIHNFFAGIAALVAGPENLKSNPNLLELKASELLFYLMESQSDILKGMLFQKINDEAARIRTTMNRHFLNNKTLDELAFMAGMSLSHFKRKFTEIYSLSPGKWIRNKKLEHAQTLLRTPDLSITDISYQSGFESTSHFIKLFKGQFGQTPNQFRKLAL